MFTCLVGSPPISLAIWPQGAPYRARTSRKMATPSPTYTSVECSNDRLGNQAAPRFLTTIDFGTTHCSVAYLLRSDQTSNPSKIDPIVLKLDNSGNRRVPSCILFDPDGKKIAFGYEAREQFVALDHELRPQHYYFEHVKKYLQYNEVNCHLRGVY